MKFIEWVAFAVVVLVPFWDLYNLPEEVGQEVHYKPDAAMLDVVLQGIVAIGIFILWDHSDATHALTYSVILWGGCILRIIRNVLEVGRHYTLSRFRAVLETVVNVGLIVMAVLLVA